MPPPPPITDHAAAILKEWILWATLCMSGTMIATMWGAVRFFAKRWLAANDHDHETLFRLAGEASRALQQLARTQTWMLVQHLHNHHDTPPPPPVDPT